MIFSKELLFSDDQAITATAISENVVNLQLPGTPFGAGAPLHQDIGKGNKIPISILVTEAFDNLTSLEIAIETGATDTLGTAILSQTILLADLTVGKSTVFDVLPNELTEQYLGLRYTVTGTAPTVGKVNAGITMGNQTNFTGA